MEQTDSDHMGGRGRSWWKEGEGTRQRTCMNDPQTWTMVWGLTLGVEGAGWKRAKGEELG